MNRAHVIRLDPTAKQCDFLTRACGVSRYTWNWALAQCDQICKATGKSANIAELKKRWNAEKPSWVYESPKDANQQPFAFLKKAWTRFFKGNGKIGRPVFKRKHEGRDSFYLSNDKIEVKGERIRLPLLGWVRLVEPLRFVGKILSVTVSRKADRWFVSVNVDVANPVPRTASSNFVGVDLGLKTTVVLSTGETINSPKPLKQLGPMLAKAQRIFARRESVKSEIHGRAVKVDSKRKADARLRVQKIHVRISNQRLDWTHKLTTRLCRENQAVVIEDLNVSGMLKAKLFSKSVSDMQFGEFRRQLEYKATAFGTTLIVADRFFPSSKKCSRCGNVKKTLLLSERTYHCEKCGLTLDRDVNAALNLRTLGLRGSHARGEEGLQAASLNRELNRECSHVLTN